MRTFTFPTQPSLLDLSETSCPRGEGHRSEVRRGFHLPHWDFRIPKRWHSFLAPTESHREICTSLCPSTAKFFPASGEYACDCGQSLGHDCAAGLVEKLELVFIAVGCYSFIPEDR